MSAAAPAYEPTTLGYLLLGLLSQGPMSGYQVRRSLETTALGRYSSSPGSIYPALERLEREGLVARGPAEGGRAPFALTGEGRARLRAWLLRPVTREDVERDDQLLLLRFAFMSGLAPRPAIRAFLVAFRDESAALAERLQSFLDGADADLPLTARLAVGCGAETARAHARWADAALGELDTAPARKSSPRSGGERRKP